MFRREPGVRQRDATDCGAACLAAIGSFYGKRVAVARVRVLAGTDAAGTNVLGLLEAAERLGFTAKGVRASPESLSRVPLPAIAHIRLENGLSHFVVLYRVARETVAVMDPREGVVSRLALQAFTDQWTGVLVLLIPGATFDPRSRSRAFVLGRFWALVQPHRSVLTQALVGALLYTILGLSTAIYVQKVVDHVLVDGNRNLLNLLSAGLALVLVAQIYLGAIRSLLALRTGQAIDGFLITGYHRHILRLPQRFFDTMRVGEIVARVGDAVKIRAFINDVALDLAVHALVVVFSFALMFSYSPRLALLIASLLPLFAAVLGVANSVNRHVLRSVMERGAELESHLVETVSTISTIKRFGLERRVERAMEARFVRLLREVYTASTNNVFSGRATELLSRAAVILLFWVGAGLVLDGVLSPGELMSCYALLGYLTGPLTQLVGANRPIQDALVAADRLFEILELEQEELEPRIALTPEIMGDIRFSNVHFRYGSRAKVFQGLDLLIRRGETTAIVGESGTGKSTIIGILQKLYPVEAGSVMVGDLDLRQLSAESVRERFASVNQDAQLSSGSVLENIVAGDPNPDIGRVVALCRQLGLLPFLQELPHGLHTPLGENGVNLSGGQRQRIAVCRALYRCPSVLLLDEATSHLDSVSESFVQKCIEGLSGTGVTVVMIAHRLSSVVMADRIVVLDGGRVAEEGRHEELLARSGRYATLWGAQHAPRYTYQHPHNRMAPAASVTTEEVDGCLLATGVGSGIALRE